MGAVLGGRDGISAVLPVKGYRRAVGRLSQFAARHWPSLILATTGTAYFVAGIVQSPARGGFAVALVSWGGGCLVLSAFAPRLTELEIGPKGMKGKLHSEREQSAGLLAGAKSPADDGEPLEEDELVVMARTALAGEAIDALLRPAEDGDLAPCKLRLYLLDKEAQLLVPIVQTGEPSAPSVEFFRPGCGATGTAFVRGERVLVAGPAVADATYGLTSEQQVHFQDLTAVASLPIFNAAGDVIGVLTASTKDPDGPERLSSENGYYEMLSRALALARVLVDLLQWFDDGYDED